MLLVAVNAACWPSYRPPPTFDPGNIRDAAPLEGTPLTLLWRSRPFRGPSAPLAHDDTIAFLGGSDRRVVALDLASGKKRWSHRFGGALLGGTLFDGTRVYVATTRPDGKVRAMDPLSGNTLWEAHTGDVEAPLTLVDETVVAATQQNGVFGLNSRNGKVRWHRRMAAQAVGPVPLGDGSVLITSYDSLYRIHARDGTVASRRRAPATVIGSWVPHGSTLVAGTGDSLVVAIDTDSLALAWQVRLDGPVVASPDVVGDTAYALTQQGSLYRVRLDSPAAAERLGQPTWPPTAGPIRFGEFLLLGGSDGVLRAVGAADGVAAWEFRIGRPVPVAPVRLDDGSLLVIGGRGDVQRVR